MRILILGGTRFLGRHIAEAALAAQHDVTLVHRGISGAGLFPQVRHLIADRDASLAPLGERETWDVAIDTSAYMPRQVRSLAPVLAGRVGAYHLISTISVYANPLVEGADEDAPRGQLADPDAATLGGETYGPLKAACEDAALAAFGPERTLIARPGLIVGPHDPTARFDWWVRRLLRGGEVLATGPHDAPVQCIDARDIADWLLHAAAAGASGAFNLTGPAEPLTMQGFLEGAAATLNPQARLKWIDGAALLREGVKPWTELPLWLPPGEAQLMTVSIRRALSAGLRLRPLALTLRDTAQWLERAPAQPQAGAFERPATGMAADKEAQLLERLPLA